MLAKLLFVHFSVIKHLVFVSSPSAYSFFEEDLANPWNFYLFPYASLKILTLQLKKLSGDFEKRIGESDEDLDHKNQNTGEARSQAAMPNTNQFDIRKKYSQVESDEEEGLKVIRIESESDNHDVRFMAENESETPLGHNFFESGSEESDYQEEEDEEHDNSFDYMNEEEKDLIFTPNDCVIMASIKLPLAVKKRENGKLELVPSGSILNHQMYNIRQKSPINAVWVGLPNYIPENTEEEEEIIKLYEEANCSPIFVDEEFNEEFYNYYEHVMKPLFYNFKGLYDDYTFENRQDNWQCYKRMNEKFASKIMEVKDKYEAERANIFIWLNNHQLFLVPQFLRRSIRDSHIGLYIHSPFPSSDVFRIFTYKHEILKSILECDCIGFHVFEQARHFMVCCKRVMGIENEMAKNGNYIVKYKKDKPVMIRIGHAGVTPSYIQNIVKSPEFKKKFDQIEMRHRRIQIASIDPLSHYSGIRAKLIAYHKFLGMKAYYKRDCKLIQYINLSKVYGEEYYQELKDSIDEMYEKIKKDYGEEVIEIVKTTSYDIERYLIWAQTDILFITNKRDGLYMSPIEYIVVRDLVGKAKKSLVVLSEFVGISRLLSGALCFNPYNIREMLWCLENAVAHCISGDTEEKFKGMLTYVNTHPIDLWAYKFLKDIKFINDKRKILIGHEGRKLLTTQIANQKKKEYLKSREFFRNYGSSRSRLIIFMVNKIQEILIDKNSETEYEEESDDISDTDFSEVTIDLIKKLSEDSHNKIWVISADTKQKVHKVFSKIENIGLAAEDGYFYRWNSKGNKGENDWSTFLRDEDCSWIELVLRLRKIYCS